MARRLLAPLLAALIAPLVVSCASLAPSKGWTGHRIDEVIAKKGQPTTIEETEGGDRLFVWEFQHDYPLDTWVSVPTGNPDVWSFTHKFVTKTSFVVAPDGTIVSWIPTDAGEIPPPK
jgi:hypothetical protein